MESVLLSDQATKEGTVSKNELMSWIKKVLDQSQTGLTINEQGKLNDPDHECGKCFLGTMGLISSISELNLGYRTEFLDNLPDDINTNVYCDPFDRLLVSKIAEDEFFPGSGGPIKTTDLAKRLLAVQNFANGMMKESEELSPDVEQTNLILKYKASILLRQVNLAATIFWGTPEQVKGKIENILLEK